MIVKAKIGAIEFTGDEVRVAVVKTGRKLPQVIELQARTAVYETPDDRVPALTRALDEALDALQTRPASYVLCVPSVLTIVRALTIPFRGQARVAKAVPFEIEPHLAFPLEELLLDFNTITERAGATEVLAIGARRKHLEEQLAILAAAGVEPEMAGVDAAGLTALWQASRRSAKGLRAVLHIRENSAILAILFNNALAYYRHMYFGLEQITSSPALVAREIQNTLRAFMANWAGDGTIDALAVTGMDTGCEELEMLGNTLGLTVTTDALIHQMNGAEAALARISDQGALNRWEAAIGAAYSACGGGLPFNLMKDSQQIHGAVRGVVAHLMFSSCLALLFLLGCGWYYHEGRLRNESLIAQIREEIDIIGDEIEAMAADGLGEDIEIAVFGDPPVIDLLKEIAAKLPENKVTIHEIRVAQPGARGGWIDITGSTNSAEDFNAAFEELKKSDMFVLAEDTNIRLQGERTTFRVRAFRNLEEMNESTT